VGAQVGQVRAAGGLRHRDRRHHLAPAHPGQPPLALFVGAEVDQVRRDHVRVDAEAGRVGGAELGQLLVEHGVEAVVGDPGAAVLGRHLEPQQPDPAGLEPAVPVDAVLAGVPLQLRPQRPVHEGAHGLPEGFVVGLEQRPLHCAPQ
jgi:hypothetical protein